MDEHSVRQAALPIVGAIDGMLIPALVSGAVARESDAMRGWGIPMATGIAFALGIVALIRDRVPSGRRVVLAALTSGQGALLDAAKAGGLAGSFVAGDAGTMLPYARRSKVAPARATTLT